MQRSHHACAEILGVPIKLAPKTERHLGQKNIAAVVSEFTNQAKLFTSCLQYGQIGSNCFIGASPKRSMFLGTKPRSLRQQPSQASSAKTGQRGKQPPTVPTSSQKERTHAV